MSTSILEEKLAKLPEEKQNEVIDFIDFLLVQSKKLKNGNKEVEKPAIFGALKGTIIMGDDFDEPLEDFKDHM